MHERNVKFGLFFRIDKLPLPSTEKTFFSTDEDKNNNNMGVCPFGFYWESTFYSCSMKPSDPTFLLVEDQVEKSVFTMIKIP